MNINRVWVMANSDTCKMKPVGDLVRRYKEKSALCIDPFARNCRIADITNDLNKDMGCNYSEYAIDFLKREEVKNADMVIFDPPYSLRQVKECYDNFGFGFTHKDSQNAIRWTEEREIIALNQKEGDIVISMGWSTTCMGKKRGYEIVEILLVSHGAAHNDTIITVERKIKSYDKRKAEEIL